MGARSGAKDARREALERLRTEQERARKRRDRLIIGISVLAALALVVPAAILIVNEQRAQDAVRAAAEGPIDGVVEVADLSANHVTTPVDYEPSPPVGGDHHPVWLNCGYYDAPVDEVHAVHSLEHGAVWITYDPELDAADVAELEELTVKHPYLLVSPYEGLGSPLVASAWGLQVELDGVDDERLPAFLTKYLQGPQTPEPGAACSGGVGA